MRNFHVSEAPACKVAGYAKAIVSDAGGDAGPSLADAARISKHNAERDLHRLFEKYWLTLKVPIKEIKVEVDGGVVVTIPLYKAGVHDTSYHTFIKSHGRSLTWWPTS